MALNRDKEEAFPQSEDSKNLVKDLYFGTAEKTQEQSPWVPASYHKPYNPDDLWQKTGDYSIYEEMEQDDQVSVAMQLKYDLILGSGWDIMTEDEGQEEMGDSLFVSLSEDPCLPLEDQLEDMISSTYAKGFSLSEKIFQKKGNELTFKALKTRHPNSWLIYTDKYGNVDKYEQQVESPTPINPKSLIHYINKPRYQNPYGRSDLRNAHDAWFVKRHLVRFFSIFAEKFASPIPVAKYDGNVPQDKVTEMFNIIKKFQQKTALVLPKAFEIDFLQHASKGEVYVDGINLFNMFIGRALFVPDLMGMSGSETAGGSFSLGQEQINIFFKHIERRRRTLEAIVNYHIIKPMVIWNYGFQENFPKFKLKPISEENTQEYARSFIEAMKGNLYKPNDEEINHFRSLIKFPEGEVEMPEARPAGQMPFAPKGVDNPVDKVDNPEMEKAAEKEVEESEKKEFGAFKKTIGDYADKVNFKAIEAQMDTMENQIIVEMRPIVDDIYNDLYDQIEKKKILEKRDIKRAESIKLKKLKQMQLVLKKHFRESYKSHQSLASDELFKRQFDAPLPNDEFLSFIDDETFKYIGDWEYRVTREAEQAMIQAIKDGKPLSSVIDVLDTKSKQNSMTSVERYSRTKGTEIANRARVDFFDKSKVVAAYQYSAILDGRTTEICRGLHGKIFKSGNQPIPPLHFNCRSVVLPITIFEEYKEDTKVGRTDIDAFIEKNKGEGFSKQ